MNINNVLKFLEELKINNNRDWFNVNKERYLVLKIDFEQLTQNLISEIGKFDKSVVGLQPKDCIFRIYRDTRFSYDKTPYKTHFGTYIAAKGGRKSEHAGYYLHFDPDGSFFSVGVWQPNPQLLKLLRVSIFENIDEWNEIIKQKQFKQTFDDGWYEEDMLKTVPREFPKDFAGGYFLRLKHYLVSKNLITADLQSPDFIHNISEIAKVGYPMNRFLNFTVDENGF